MGKIKVPDDKYSETQSERSLENFKIGTEKIPKTLIYTLEKQKKAATLANKSIGKLNSKITDALQMLLIKF